jgi:hypothetical protein
MIGPSATENSPKCLISLPLPCDEGRAQQAEIRRNCEIISTLTA